MSNRNPNCSEPPLQRSCKWRETGSSYYLLYNIDAVVDLLSLEKGVQVVEKGSQVVLPVPVRNNNGCVMPRSAVGGLVLTTRQH